MPTVDTPTSQTDGRLPIAIPRQHYVHRAVKTRRKVIIMVVLCYTDSDHKHECMRALRVDGRSTDRFVTAVGMLQHAFCQQHFLLGVSIVCYAEPCNAYHLSVRLTLATCTTQATIGSGNLYRRIASKDSLGDIRFIQKFEGLLPSEGIKLQWPFQIRW